MRTPATLEAEYSLISVRFAATYVPASCTYAQVSRMAPQYLKRRHNAWSVRVQVPRHLWAAAGTREYVRALGTTDLKEAERRKHNHVAEFKRRIAELQRGSTDPMRDVYQKALEFRDAVARGQGVVFHEDETLGEFMLSEALDETKEVQEAYGEEEADRFMRIVRGEGRFLRDVYPRWLEE